MPNVTHYLVPAVLTDAQEQVFETAVNAAGNAADGFRAIGTAAEASMLDVVGYAAPGPMEGDKWPTRNLYRTPETAWPDALIRQADAVAQIASRDAKIAELTARLDTIVQETREACAQLCLAEMVEDTGDPSDVSYNAACSHCEGAIRNAGEKA